MLKELRGSEPGKSDEHDPGRRPVEPVVVPVCPSRNGKQQEGERNGRDADRHPAEPDRVGHLPVVEDTPEVHEGRESPAHQQEVRPRNGSSLKLSPFILEIVGQELRMWAGDVWQDDPGYQDRAGYRQHRQRKNEDNPPGLYW